MCFVQTFRLMRSTMPKNTKFVDKVANEIKIDDVFSENDDPVLLNMSVT